MNLRTRITRCVNGTILLYLTQVGALIAIVKYSLVQAGHPQSGSQWLWEFADNFFESFGKQSFPVLIWLVFSLPYLLGKVDPNLSTRAETAVGRNAPCPCGSGKKYKRCCGI